MRTEIIYLDDKQQVVTKESATQFEIVEYAQGDEVIARTYGILDREILTAEVLAQNLDEGSLQELLEDI